MRCREPRGNSSFIGDGTHVPFGIKRVYYLYDVLGCETRAGYALRTTQQFIIADSGSFDMILELHRGCWWRKHATKSRSALRIPTPPFAAFLYWPIAAPSSMRPRRALRDWAL